MRKFLIFPCLLLVLLFGGCANVSNGEQQGFITTVEENGLIWKTGLAYIKTELESSQEDDYCVTDETVVNALKEAQTFKNRVKIFYHEELITAPWRCGKNNTIIDSVENIK